jgi:hypothetical protein
MTCKLSPIITPYRITLGNTPGITVEADILSYDNRDVFLEGFVKAICILSTDRDFDIKSLLEDDWHRENPTWWQSYTGGDIVAGQAITALDTNPVFNIELTDSVSPEDWENVDYLSFFTYVQIDTQAMENQYNIEIPPEFENMVGEYLTAIVLNKESIDIKVVTDNRDEVVEKDSC